jgi:hypothetical protein
MGVIPVHLTADIAESQRPSAFYARDVMEVAVFCFRFERAITRQNNPVLWALDPVEIDGIPSRWTRQAIVYAQYREHLEKSTT